MKLIIFFIVCFLTIQLSFGRCPLPDAKDEGAECNTDRECIHPLFCLNGVCTKQPRTDSKCTNQTDCSPAITGMSCIAAKCVVTSMNGERCDRYQCNSLAQCNEGYCGDAKCFQQSDCGYNSYCNKDTQLCEKTNVTCESDSNCGFGGVCSNGTCHLRYAGSLGEKCLKSEQCNIFAGYMCDPIGKKCVKSEAYGKTCYVDGECNGGMCRCNKDNEDQCYGYAGAITDSHCFRQHQAIQRCIEDNRCNRMLPFTCDRCYPKYICFLSTCFADKLFDPRYKLEAEKCSTVISEAGSFEDLPPGDKADTATGGSGSNDSSMLVIPMTLLLISHVLTLFI
ncbi:hypothetical protein DFA_04706 [Cavenderia fasciculata]|uniref:Dickkopf N-terminal cysteine-rich domain-containing protein n=1 Tax=Cavenderia fasciculata TaxID=261658 RepID=F4PQB3_CACFS|nr:uncharacterized protein DFA_04706 [Cavenderia fasciculata]EGG22576.1 hypothetical protein DFA_04706 [Cavenderia fasciculata]|eukprot:XP_004360427.1 hypothetical protein DFA_04706 [Cavenderia fasciculata]